MATISRRISKESAEFSESTSQSGLTVKNFPIFWISGRTTLQKVSYPKNLHLSTAFCFFDLTQKLLNHPKSTASLNRAVSRCTARTESSGTRLLHLGSPSLKASLFEHYWSNIRDGRLKLGRESVVAVIGQTYPIQDFDPAIRAAVR
jgi:hypothetical protein